MLFKVRTGNSSQSGGAHLLAADAIDALEKVRQLIEDGAVDVRVFDLDERPISLKELRTHA